MTTTAPRIVVEFAGRRVPVQVVQAHTKGADWYATNVTCLHSRAGGVSFYATVVVLWSSGRWVEDNGKQCATAEEQAKQLRTLGYQNVRVERT